MPSLKMLWPSAALKISAGVDCLSITQVEKLRETLRNDWKNNKYLNLRDSQNTSSWAGEDNIPDLQ